MVAIVGCRAETWTEKWWRLSFEPVTEARDRALDRLVTFDVGSPRPGLSTFRLLTETLR